MFGETNGDAGGFDEPRLEEPRVRVTRLGLQEWGFGIQIDLDKFLFLSGSK